MSKCAAVFRRRYLPQPEHWPAALRVAVPLEPVEVLRAGRRLPHLATRPRPVAALLPPRHGADFHAVVGVGLQEVESRPLRPLARGVLRLDLGAEGVLSDAAVRVQKVRRALELDVVELDLSVPLCRRLPLDLEGVGRGVTVYPPP